MWPYAWLAIAFLLGVVEFLGTRRGLGPAAPVQAADALGTETTADAQRIHCRVARTDDDHAQLVRDIEMFRMKKMQARD